MEKEYLGPADVPESCLGDIRVQFMMIGRYTQKPTDAHTHTYIYICTRFTGAHACTLKAMEALISRLVDGGIIHCMNVIISVVIW